MHDIWNPWHGCIKYSEGCDNCYMYYLDKKRDKKGSDIYKVKNNFNYPLQKNRNGHYKIKSGELIRLCLTSDFFLEEADKWRDEVWEMMRIRSDVKFLILTKRIQRVEQCLPQYWDNGWENISLNVTCENQKRADERIPILLKLPFKHKGIVCAPLLSEINIETYLKTGAVEQVICGGENYDGARPCDFDWVKSLRNQCEKYDINFCFMETGTVFIKDGKKYNLPSKKLQSQMAKKSNMNYEGKEIKYKLTDGFGIEIPSEYLYKPHYKENCKYCGSRSICNGCADCNICISQ